MAFRGTAYQGMPRTDYVKAGRWVRRNFSLTKEEHVGVANDYLNDAGRLMGEYYRHVNRELGFLRHAGTDPGPLISGVVSDKFPARVKEGLRQQLTEINWLVDAAMGHYAAAGKRIQTYRAEFHRRVTERVGV